MINRRHISKGLIGLFVLFVLIAVLFPFYWTIASSFKEYVEMFSTPPTFIPHSFTLENYAKVLEGNFPRAIGNSLSIAVVSTVVALVLGVPAAYAFSRYSFKFSNVLFFIILAVRMFPAVSFMVPMYLMFRTFGLYNTRTALIISYLTFQLPFIIWMVEGFLGSIPQELEEAGRIDGCSRFGVFARLIVPLAIPGISVAAVFSAIMSWNEFPYALVLTSTAVAKTAPVSIAETITSYQIAWGEMTASGTMLIVPVLLFSLYVQKYMVKAIVSGAVKG